jgi:hypothetical protein
MQAAQETTHSIVTTVTLELTLPEANALEGIAEHYQMCGQVAGYLEIAKNLKDCLRPTIKAALVDHQRLTPGSMPPGADH